MTRVSTASEGARWLAAQSCSCGARMFGRDPVLAEQAGALVLRYAGCARCMQPAHVDAHLPQTFDQVVAGKHVLEPSVIAALAPLIESGFPEYAAPALERIDASRLSLGPDWLLEQWLRGSFGYGQARCVRRDGVRALATFSVPPAVPLQRALEQLTLTTRGVAPILDLRLTGEYAVLFEEEPRGVPLSTSMFPLALDVALVVLGHLLELAGQAAERGEVLRGLRPELVYVDRDATVRAAPRAERFAMMRPDSQDLSPESPFETLYCGPEVMHGTKLTSAHDVFSCCAIFVFLLTRRQPYPGAGYMQQIAAMMKAPPELPAALDPRTAQLVRAGLDPNPAKRPGVRDIASSIIVS